MSRTCKYHIGDKLGSENILFLRESRVKKRHRLGIFECPICHNEFEAEPSRVARNEVKSCNSCKTRSNVIYTVGSYGGKNNNILILQRKVNNNAKVVRAKCPECGREDWIVDSGNLYKISHCKECDKKRREKQFSNLKKFNPGDKVGPFNLPLIRYTQYGPQIHSKGIFICPLCGEEFEYRIEHIEKGKIANCNLCSKSMSIGELFIKNTLEDEGILYEKEKVFDKCRNLKTNYPLRFDFYLPEYNCCIEYDGAQHFRPVDCFGGEEEFEKIVYRDDIKNKFCKDNNITIIRFSYKNSFEYIKRAIKDFIAVRR